MTPLGLTLVLAAALCHATWNFFVKRINGGPELVWLFSALSTVLYLPLAIAIVVLQEVTFDLEQSLFIAVSVALHLAYVLSPLAYILVLHALTLTPVAYVAPLREVSVLLTVLAASLLLGEGRLRRRLIWSAVIVGGVVLLAQG